MRRIFLVLVICAFTSLAGVASSQAATGIGGAAGSGLKAAAKEPKPTKYRVVVYNLNHEQYNEGTANLYNKTKTWNVEFYCDTGTFTKAGKALTLSDTCTNETWSLTKVKPPAKNTYYGPATNNETHAVDYYVEMIKI